MVINLKNAFYFPLLLALLAACSAAPEASVTTEAHLKAGKEAIQSFLQNQEGSFTEVSPGLWLQMLSPGDSLRPSLSSVVTVAYRCTGLNGFVLDSATTAQPLRSRLARLIPGWKQTLPLIGQGGSLKIVVNADLAYGSRFLHPELGAWAPLFYEVTLIEVSPYQP